MPRAHDYDMNDGSLVIFNGDNTLTKFGFDYDPAVDLFATLIRVRNDGIEGFSPVPIQGGDGTTVFFGQVVASGKKPDIGSLSVRDASQFSYFDGTIGTETLEAWDEGAIEIVYDNGSTPTIDGVAIAADGVQNLTRDFAHTVVFDNTVTSVETTFTVVLHDLATFELDEGL